jgi:hypothetical protein
MRSFLACVALLALVAGVAVADAQQPQQQQQPNTDQKQQQQQQPNADQKNAGQADRTGLVEATITDVDREKGTIKVQMKDAQGKETERTFRLTGGIRYFDSNGNVAAVNIFRSGNKVLVIEREGNLQEIRQKRDSLPDENKQQPEQPQPPQDR